MLIDETLIREKIFHKDYKWFSSGGNRSRLKRFFKTNQLPDDLLLELWKIREIRYDLVSLQKLPESIIIDIISKVGLKSRDITKAIYTETLIKQEITQNLIEQYIMKLDLGLIFLTWETIPKTMSQYIDFDSFLQSVCGMNNDFYTFLNERKGALISIIRADNSKFEPAVKFICSMPSTVSFEFLSVFSNIVYFSDEIISYMRTNLDDVFFYSLMEHIISRNNCSINMKARFLLEK